jgi:hypothetical protein
MMNEQVHVDFNISTTAGSVNVTHNFTATSKDEMGKQLHRLYWQIRDALRLEDAGL